MGATVRLRGEGNVVWEFHLPLSEVYADQVKAAKLIPADDDSAAAVADLFDAELPTAPEAEPDEKPLEKMKLAELIEHAEKNGVPPETLAELRKPGASKAQALAAIHAAAA